MRYYIMILFLWWILSWQTNGMEMNVRCLLSRAITTVLNRVVVHVRRKERARHWDSASIGRLCPARNDDGQHRNKCKCCSYLFRYILSAVFRSWRNSMYTCYTIFLTGVQLSSTRDTYFLEGIECARSDNVRLSDSDLNLYSSAMSQS